MSLYSSLQQVLAPFAAKINGLLTGYDGTEYDTPGEAVREQINDLHVLIGHEPGTVISGSAISYDNTDSGMTATDVQSALDETNERLAQLNGVPSDVRVAIAKLLKLVPYIPDLDTDPTGETEYDLSDDFDIIDAWAAIHATAISLSDNSISFTAAGTKKLTATLTPSDSDDEVMWTSSDTSVASVSNDGTVTAVGNGTCTIVASVGSLVANCSVTVSGIVFTYSVTNTLTGATNSNSATTATGGASYSGTLSATTGYTMTGATVSVTMGGVDVTSTVYSNGAISISEVTGNIVITAVAVESPVYSFENGTYTFGDGSFVKVENGNRVTGSVASSNSGGLHANMSSLSDNTSTAGDYAHNYVSGQNKLFTIPEGSTVRCEVTPVAVTCSTTTQAGKNINARLVKQSASFVDADSAAFVLFTQKINEFVIGTPVVRETVISADTDIYTAAFYIAHNSTNTAVVTMDIKIYVNGIRYI